jgi:hypothetical protein
MHQTYILLIWPRDLDKENVLVVEPDYLPDSEVFVFSHVYTP